MHTSVEMSEVRSRCPLCHEEWLDIAAFSERRTTERLRLTCRYFAAVLASEGGRLPLYRAEAFSLRGIDNASSIAVFRRHRNPHFSVVRLFMTGFSSFGHGMCLIISNKQQSKPKRWWTFKFENRIGIRPAH